MFYGPATPSQFENLLVWRKRGRAKATTQAAVPDVPEPRREIDELQPESFDLYALSVGRPTGN
jgi:hypothetical protein